MHPTKTLAAVAALSTLLIGGTALAGGHNKVDPEVKYRQDTMEAMSHHFSALAAIFTGRVDRPGALQVHAEALAATAALTGSLFPEGSEGGNALPKAWEEPEKVQFAAKMISESTAALAEAAAGGDKAAIAGAFKKAGDGCKNCHEAFKAEDE